MKQSLLFLAVSALLGACTQGGQSTGIATITCPTDSTLTYENYGQAVIQEQCLECHNGKESPNLSTQAKIQSRTSQILHEAVYTDAMPEDGNMTIAERQMLGEWLACGAP